jgi:hypothetical protein
MVTHVYQGELRLCYIFDTVILHNRANTVQVVTPRGKMNSCRIVAWSGIVNSRTDISEPKLVQNVPCNETNMEVR